MTADHSPLVEVIDILAHRYDGPHCVDASATLVEAGTLLGYALEAHAVSLFAVGTEGAVVTGKRGRTYGEEQMGAEAVVQPESAGAFCGDDAFQAHAGHMVVLSPKYRLFMDPTFAQFSRLGAGAQPLFAEEIQLREEGFWTLRDDTFYARWYVADEFMPDDFAAVRASKVAEAAAIVEHVREILAKP